MKIVRPVCRYRLTGEDIDFILSVFGYSRDGGNTLIDLLTDPDSRDLILDDHKLVDRLQDDPHSLRVSPHLYFYLLVRHGMLRHGLNDREVSDYVAELLVEFGTEKERSKNQRPSPEAAASVVDMLALLDGANDYARFVVRSHVGNLALFMTGIYPERITARKARRGAPGLRFYEGLGKTNFTAASALRAAGEFEVANVLATLGERFHEVRVALNDMTERFLFLAWPQTRLLLAG